LFFTIPRRIRKQWSRRVQLTLLMLISLGAVTATIGCGGRAHTTSTIVITATSGSDAHTTTVQLTVK